MTTDQSTSLLSHAEIFRVMIEESPLPVSIQGSDWRFVYVNQAYCRYTGYPEQQLLGRDPAKFLFPPENEPGLVDIRKAVSPESLNQLPKYPTVRELLRRDGSRVKFRVDISHSRTEAGEDLWCGILFDLTDMQRIRSEMREHQQVSDTMQIRFDSFAELSNEAMIVVDLSADKILHVNSVVAGILGVDADITDRAIAELWRNIAADDVTRLSRMVAGGQSRRGNEATVMLEHPQLAERSLRIRMFNTIHPNAETFILVEDITEHILLEEQRLNAAVMRRDVLIREVHHRIKNNLQGVVGVLENAKDSEGTTAAVLDEALHKVNTIAQVNGMLSTAGPEIPLRDLIGTLANYLQENFGTEILVSATKPDNQLPPLSVDTDAVPIALVVNELLSNAHKHRRGSQAVGVDINENRRGMQIVISNQGLLHDGFSFQLVRPGVRGLGLVKALLPGSGANLSFNQVADYVQATLTLDRGLHREKEASGESPPPATY